MTLAAISPVVSYAETGSLATLYPVPFQFKAASHLKVTRSVAGVESEVTGVTVSGDGGAGTASIQLASSTAGATLRIERATPRTQGTDLTFRGDLPSSVVEDALDRHFMAIQEVDAELDRVPMLPAGEMAPALPSLADLEGKVLAVIDGKFVPVANDSVAVAEALTLAAGYALVAENAATAANTDAGATAADRTVASTKAAQAAASASFLSAAIEQFLADIADGTLDYAGEFTSIALGLAGSTNGQVFRVNANSLITYYTNNSGTAAPSFNYELSSLTVQTIGLQGTPVSGSSSGAGGVFAFNAPVAVGGALTSVKIFSPAGGSIEARRFEKSGDGFTQVGAGVELALAVGLQTLDVGDIGSFPVNAGQYLGFLTNNAGAMGFTTSGTAADTYYDNGFAGDTASFTDAAPTSGVNIQLSFEVTSSRFGSIESRLDLMDAAASAVDLPIGDRIASAQAVISGFGVAVTGELSRDGGSTSFSDTVTLDAPASGKLRLDQIGLNLETLALVVTKGTESTVADFSERPPVTPAGVRPLFSALVSQAAYNGQTVYVTPQWALEDGTLRSLLDPRQADAARNRRAVADLVAAHRAGEPITHIMTGDSIGAWSNNAATAPSNSTPNGINRDVKGYPKNTGGTQYIQNDLIDALDTFDHGDGAGAVHLHASKFWLFSTALARGGSDVQTLNFCISGTTSGTGKSGVDGNGSNGRDPTLLNAVVAAVVAAVAAGRRAIVSIGFGMNERGSTSTRANIIAIEQAVYAAGGEVIVWGCPRPNTASNNSTDWRYTNRALRQAAEYVDPATGKSAAFIDVQRIYDDAALGSIGVPGFALCTANANNHPGIREHAREAREAIDMLVLS
jgi:hypothetical protein